MEDDARDRFRGKAPKRGVGALKGYGQASPLSEAVSGFVGAPRRFSVMDPQAQTMQQARDIGEQASVASQLYSALAPFAAGATMAKAGQMGGISPLTVYHGSPHRFAKFDAGKIGTGEGAQSYGHGLYFAENPEVAKGYQKRLSHSNYVNAITGNLVESGKAWTDALKAVQNTGINKVQHPVLAGAIASQIQDWVDSGRTARSFLLNYQVPKDVESAYEAAINSFDGYRKNKGSFYTVDLPDEKIARMLDFDKPLSEQAPDVLRALDASNLRFFDLPKRDFVKASESSTLAGEAYKALEQRFGFKGAQTAASLREAGVPGIKYLDQASRGAKQGTRNFVVFPGEEDALKILDVYAKGGAVRMQEGGPLSQFMGKTPKRGVSSLPGYGQGADEPAAQVALGARRNIGEFGRALVGAKPYDETNPTGTYRTVQALLNMPTPAAIIPEAAQAAGKAAGALSGLGAAAGVMKPVGGKQIASSIERALSKLKTPEIQPLSRAEMLNELAQKGEPVAASEVARILAPVEIKVQPEMPVEMPRVDEVKPPVSVIKNDAELIMERGQAPATIDRAEVALDSGQRVYKIEENGKQTQIIDAQGLANVDPTNLRVVTILPEEFEAVNLAAKNNPEAQRAMFDQVESLHRNFAPEEGWEKINIIKGNVKLDKEGSVVINRQTGLPMTEVEVAKIPYAFHIPPEGIPQELWEETLAARIADEVNQILQRAQSGEQDAIDILAEAKWYRSMRDRLRNEFGGIGDVFADVLGATSAQTGVEQNFDNGIEILRRFARGDFDKELLAYEKRVRSGETVDGTMLTRMFRNNEFPLITKAGGQLFNANSPAAMGALLDMFRAVKAGDSPKTPNFTGNLIGLTNEATIDVWAARMLRRLADLLRIPPPAEKGVAGLHKVGSTLYQPNIGSEFGFGQNVFRRAAEELNNAGALKTYDSSIGDLGPDDLQAIAWFIEKELWAQNKWTTKTGEGGSLDYEMSFAGSLESQKIKSLRREINKEFSGKNFPQRKTENNVEYAKRLEQERIAFEKDKANKIEQLKNLRADVSRYRLGISGERPSKPMSDYGQAELASEFDDVVRDDPGVITYNLTSTLGSFMGDTERALNAEFITAQNFNPLPLERRLVEQGKHYDRDAVFISKVVSSSTPNARPGVEIYFKKKLTSAEMAQVTQKLRDYGVDRFTYIIDMRLENRPNLRVTTQSMQNKTFRPFAEELRPEPGSSGITFQYIPEFDDTFDAANAVAIMQQREDIFHKIVGDMLNAGNVSDARLMHFDTKVFFRKDYDDYLARTTGPSYQKPRREQQVGPSNTQSNNGGKNQQKLQRAVSDRIREETSGQTVNKPPPAPGMARGGAVRISQYRPNLLHHKFDEEFAAGGAVKPKTSRLRVPITQDRDVMLLELTRAK